MSAEILSIEDLKFIKESLSYTKQKFENYEYPTQEFKQQRINEVISLIAKVDAQIQKQKKLSF